MSACSSSSSTPATTPTSPSVVAKGARVIGMDTNDAAADFNFNQSYALAQSIGVGAGTFHLDWNTDEGAGSGSTSGTLTDVSSSLAIINAFYPATTPSSLVSLTIAPIDTPGAELPSDLSGDSMDNSNVIVRFTKFMDWALTQTPNVNFTSIQIGNEIDAPSAASSALYWSQYKTFLTSVVSHIHGTKPGVKVGVTVTLYGLLGQSGNGSVAQTGILSLLSVVDELGLTYYPLDGNFYVKSPSVAATDIAQVFTLVGSTPIYFQEVGYPTSSGCGGSEANQSLFIDQIFSAWDLHASQIPFLSFLRMNDYSSSNATSVASNYGLSGNTAFVAYLQTLGFRTYSSPSSTKPAWSELQNQTHLRGWW